jgi:hypothetical protein
MNPAETELRRTIARVWQLLNEDDTRALPVAAGIEARAAVAWGLIERQSLDARVSVHDATEGDYVADEKAATDLEDAIAGLLAIERERRVLPVQCDFREEMHGELTGRHVWRCTREKGHEDNPGDPGHDMGQRVTP